MHIFFLFVGLSILFLLSILSPLPQIHIDPLDLSYSTEYTEVEVSGKILDIQDFGSLRVIHIEHCGAVEILSFDEVSASKNEYVRVIGSVEKRHGKNQIIAQSITARSLTAHSQNPN
ncbi:MAG: hypothetical protein ACMXYA_00575 [Candidatus Woesearchaeota archaeon]